MKIIISPAKKMNDETDLLPVKRMPVFLDKTREIYDRIRQMSYEELKALWKCNDKLTELNYRRFASMDLEEHLTPAVLSYEGLQYQHMGPAVFTEAALDYIDAHLRILSGFYGVLAPFDGVAPYRLEMQAALTVGDSKNLYEFWGDRLYRAVLDEDRMIVNLASKEYSQAVEPYLTNEDRIINCIFGEEKEGKIVQKGTLAKMARGEMVRYMAETNLTEPERMKEFAALGFAFDEGRSSEREFVFVK